MKLYFVLFFSGFPFRKDKACHGEDGTENGEGSDNFSQKEHGCNHGDGRFQIDIDPGFYGTENANGIVPGDKADGRCPQPQIEEIENIFAF